MYNMPFFGFPSYRNYYSRSNYSRNPYHRNTYFNSGIRQEEHKEENLLQNNDNIEENSLKNSDNVDENDKNSSTRGFSSTTNQPFINILGLNLYSDDILIICVLFSLYTEGIKDEMLFICLILLLFS